jgi:deazaflavin-dependent oxidoreductase (nitroreductase family)
MSPAARCDAPNPLQRRTVESAFAAARWGGQRVMEIAAFATRRTVRLTTRGRKSGRPRTVKLWFVVAGPSSIFVQHASSAPAQWYRNVLKDPAVEVDFGSGAMRARARSIDDRHKVVEILRLVRRKYPFAWLVQLIGRKAQPLAAEIVLEG